MQAATQPRFQSYTDVVKAIDAAAAKADLEQLSESVNQEYELGRLDMTANDWGDFAARLVMRDDAIERGPTQVVCATQSKGQNAAVLIDRVDPIKAAIAVLRNGHPALAAAVEQLAGRPTGLVPEASVVHVENEDGSLYVVSCRLSGDDDDSVFYIRCSTEGDAQAVALRELYAESCSDQDPASPDYREHFIISSQLVAAPARV
ncbi:hypothetical protein ACSVIJ_05185 [Pseudomonas sp. NCHU5208]|uniref:hypothetical protein n=1 Tax=unclassified Pseudomonas TaxID=196821 RepID=UPI003F9576A4